MKIGHFIPAYREVVRAQVAFNMLENLASLKAQEEAYGGHIEYYPWYRSSCHIVRSRNAALRTAIDRDYDFLLMQDSDCFLRMGHGGGLTHLLRTIGETSAAAVGAVFVCRDQGRVNCSPARPGRVYEGEVGTGLMLIDVRQAAAVEPPWFVLQLDETGEVVELSEDIYFCRRLRESGKRVVVDYTLPTGHVHETPLWCLPANLAAEGAISDDEGDDSLRTVEDGIAAAE